jgi:hypothetical protein
MLLLTLLHNRLLCNTEQEEQQGGELRDNG